MSRKDAQQSEDRSSWSYAELLEWHIRSNTRPHSLPREARWTFTNFCNAIDVDDRYIRFWRNGVLPNDKHRQLIETTLFGNDFSLEHFRIELRTAYNRAAPQNKNRLSKGASPRKRPLTAENRLLPEIFHVAYRPNPNFTGRSELLFSLEKALRGGNAAITGTAGIGKTTLVAEYCHLFGAKFGGVWWVRAETNQIMIRDLQTLAQRLGLKSRGSIASDARAAIEWLATFKIPWLLVYDNAQDPDSVRDWLPIGAVRCIVTSRRTEFGDIAPLIFVNVWPDDITANFLIMRARRGDTAGATRLAQQLGGLPLAAEQAGAYLCSRPGFSFDEYGADIARLIKQGRPRGAEGEYPLTVYAAFVKSIEALEKTDESEVPLDVLRLCAFLSPDGVDVELLQEHTYALPRSLAGGIQEKLFRNSSFAALASLSLMRYGDGPTGVILVFHRLLLEVVRDWMGEDARSLWGTASLELVSSAFSFDGDHTAATLLNTAGTLFKCAQLVPHVIRFIPMNPPDEETGYKLGLLLNEAGVYHSVCGDNETALKFAKRSVELARAWFRYEPLELAKRLSNLAGFYVVENELQAAEDAYRESLEIKRALLPPEDDGIALTLSNYAEVTYLQGKFEEAEKLNLYAAQIRMDVHGSDSFEYGRILANLGRLYGKWGETSGNKERYLQAEEVAFQALVNTAAAVGSRSPATARIYDVIAWLKYLQDDFENAANFAERAVAIMWSLGMANNTLGQSFARHLAGYWSKSNQSEKAARLRSGIPTDLITAVMQIESEHYSWVSLDSERRDFGAPSAALKLRK